MSTNDDDNALKNWLLKDKKAFEKHKMKRINNAKGKSNSSNKARSRRNKDS